VPLDLGAFGSHEPVLAPRAERQVLHKGAFAISYLTRASPHQRRHPVVLSWSFPVLFLNSGKIGQPHYESGCSQRPGLGLSFQTSPSLLAGSIWNCLAIS
jgi:hypothetical protein